MAKFNLYAHDLPPTPLPAAPAHKLSMGWLGVALIWAGLVFVATFALLAL